MGRLLLILALGLAGAGAGAGLGFVMKPEAHGPAPDGTAGPDATAQELGAGEDGATRPVDAAEDPGMRPMPDRVRPPLEERDFVRINNQFVVPVLEAGTVRALVVLSISLEAHVGMRPTIFAREPKLRDAMLQVMFDHANAGGFSGNFTQADRLEILRRSLWEAARPILGPDVYDVLITDIARQDT